MRKSNGDVLFCWPLEKHIITAGWTYNDGSAHHAIDMRAAPCTPVYAAEDGIVNQVQSWDGKTKFGMQSYGNMVRLGITIIMVLSWKRAMRTLKNVSSKTANTFTRVSLLGILAQLVIAMVHTFTLK